MIYTIRNLIRVVYSPPARLARFNLRLRPAQWPHQRLLDYASKVTPSPAELHEQTGPYLVNRTRLVLDAVMPVLRIETILRVEVFAPEIDPQAAPTIGAVRAAAMAHGDLGATGPTTYLFSSPIADPSDEIAAWGRSWLENQTSVLAGGTALMQAIYRDFAYKSGATNSYTPPIDAFRARHGVCQDFAHVMIIAARAHGIPAAYVSGYLRTRPPPGKPRLVGADAMHAWVALWCGDALGWVGFDPTNNCLTGTNHIFTAMGRDYTDVAPLDGVFRGGGRQKMKLSVDVAPQDEVTLATA